MKIIDATILDGTLSNRIINIVNSSNIKVVDLVKYVIQVYQKSVNLRIVNAGGEFEQINIDLILPFIEQLDIKFGEFYYLNAIKRII